MTKIVNHIKHNVIAYLALFVALGGTSYAAINLPAGSVGTKQLRNGAVTPRKLDPSSIAGYVRDYAEVRAGKLVSSRPRARVIAWNTSGSLPSGTIQWSKPIPSSCFALANSLSPAPSYVSTELGSGGSKAPGGVFLFLSNGQSDVQVAVICPQP